MTKGVRAVLNKLKTVKAWPLPKIVKVLRGFLGLIGYYKRFIKYYGLTKQNTLGMLYHFIHCFHMSTCLWLMGSQIVYLNFSQLHVSLLKLWKGYWIAITNYSLRILCRQPTVWSKTLTTPVAEYFLFKWVKCPCFVNLSMMTMITSFPSDFGSASIKFILMFVHGLVGIDRDTR